MPSLASVDTTHEWAAQTCRQMPIHIKIKQINPVNLKGLHSMCRNYAVVTLIIFAALGMDQGLRHGKQTLLLSCTQSAALLFVVILEPSGDSILVQQAVLLQVLRKTQSKRSPWFVPERLPLRLQSQSLQKKGNSYFFFFSQS